MLRNQSYPHKRENEQSRHTIFAEGNGNASDAMHNVERGEPTASLCNVVHNQKRELHFRFGRGHTEKETREETKLQRSWKGKVSDRKRKREIRQENKNQAFA